VKVAVVAHAGKSLGGGLPQLRQVLERPGVELLWREVPRSRKAPKQVRKALAWGAELVFVWGGDGMVQRSAGVLAGSDAALAIVPAGTANLLARNLGIPADVEAAVAVGLAGVRRRLDLGRLNGEPFAVMAGAGFDGAMIAGADGRLKDRLGRLAYVWSGARSLRREPFGVRIAVDGADWYDGKASCVLVGNVGRLFGGLEAFDGARPDDGSLELGVVQADGVVQWLRTLARASVGGASRSRYTRTTRARSARVRVDRKVPYELDGGDRGTVRKLRIDVLPGALTVCVPAR
jgi:YegS/Rv2252/BmrU family lipid kinase